MSSSGGGTEPVGDVPKAPTPSNDAVGSAGGPSAEQEAPGGGSGEDIKENERTTSSASPALQPQPNTYQQGYPPHLTPQPGPGYYLGYQQQITPEPPSPGGPNATAGYDVASFLQQQAAFVQQSAVMNSPFGASAPYNNIPQPPLSPRGGVLPPPSPLFPRANNSAVISASALDPDSSGPQRGPPSPSAYLSPPLGPSGGTGYSGMYHGYGGSYHGNLSGSEHEANSSNSPDGTSWADRAQQQNPYQQAASPQLQAQGLAIQYAAGMARAAANHRANSFDDMLPPPVLDQHEQSPVTYSPYGASAQTGGSGGTMFAHPQPWGYGGPGDMYAPNSPLQPRPNPAHQIPGQYGGGQGGGMRQMGGYPGPGMPPYYPASSPGPPIQTTPSNKGPDGANLFIFHIPNHFTNLDMYHLFCQYGNLISVRIMVEKDSGRSRGFGFVSYDSPESAVMAIKELNGFAIGNKRLKVQHKQIRTDRQQEHQHSFASSTDSLPPSNRWYDSQRPAPQAAPQGSPDAHTEDSGTSDAVLLGHASAGGQVLGSPNDENRKAAANAQSKAGGPESPAKSGADISCTAAPGSGGVEISRAAGSSTLSPLGNLEPMRNALPDVSD